MQVIENADAPISAQIARSIAERYTGDLTRVRLSIATVVHGGGSRATPPPSRLRVQPPGPDVRPHEYA